MKFLLDTNVCIRIMRGDETVRHNLQRVTPNDCGVSMITVFELFAGIERCANPEKETIKVKRFLSAFHLLPFDWDSAIRTAKIRWQLEKIGQPIGPYDFQLAGQAIALELTLITHNTREFSRVPSLSYKDWQK